MGSCISADRHPPNFFFVKNINEDKNLVQKGLLEVSETELIYTDNTSADRWTWPLKYLRKYGCDGEVFSFEAGRKCPGGEGLYAFSSKRASKIFELVARNINLGEHQSNGDLTSEAHPGQADRDTLSFARQRTPPPVQPEGNYTNLPQEGNYTNLTPNGLPIIQEPGETVTVTSYTEVAFQKPAEEHPKPQAPQNSPSYAQIDIQKTQQHSRERLTGTLLDNQNPHRSSGSVSLPANRTKHRHNRLNTVSNPRRSSDSSYSSQSSLTESSRNLTSPQVNGQFAHPGVIGEEPSEAATYQNVLLAQQDMQGSANIESRVPQPNGQANGQSIGQLYQNVNVGQGSVSDVFVTGSLDQRANTMNGSVTPNAIRVNGMGSYAVVEPVIVRARATSTPVQQSYADMDFKRDGQNSSETGSNSFVPEPSPGSNPGTPDLSLIRTPVQSTRTHSNSELPPVKEVKDETTVAYGTLDFRAMTALGETTMNRQLEGANAHDISDRMSSRNEKDSKERRTSTSHFPKRKSHKDK